MGGNAAIIAGTVDARLLQPRAAKPGLMDRLLSRSKLVGPREIPLGKDQVMVELPADEFVRLARDFEDYLRRTIKSPWDSTQRFLLYRTVKPLALYLRGERPVESCEVGWYLQFSFSGCGGMAEISSELGSHWIEHWFRQEGAQIQSDILSPLGFHNGAVQESAAGSVFVPFEGIGYGKRVMDSGTADPKWVGSRWFEFDCSETEALEQENKLDKLRELDEKFGQLGSDGKCLCQLCNPSFSPPTVAL